MNSDFKFDIKFKKEIDAKLNSKKPHNSYKNFDYFIKTFHVCYESHANVLLTNQRHLFGDVMAR